MAWVIDGLGDSSVGQARSSLGPPLSSEGQSQLTCTQTVKISCPMSVLMCGVSSPECGASYARDVSSGPMRGEANSLMRSRASIPDVAARVRQGQISQGQ